MHAQLGQGMPVRCSEEELQDPLVMRLWEEAIENGDGALTYMSIIKGSRWMGIHT